MGFRQIAGKGLYFLFIGQILGILMLVPVIGTIAALAGAVCSIYGLYTLSKADADYQTAFMLTIANFAVSLFSTVILNNEGIFAFLCSAASLVINAAVIYFICSTTGRLLRGIDDTVEQRGGIIWRAVMLCTIVEIACALLVYIPIINIAAMVIQVIAMVIQLVISILYLIFLWQGQKTLRQCSQ